MKIKKRFFHIFLLLPTMYFCLYYINDFSPYIYIETEDYYNYIVIADESNKPRKILVPFGVFSVKKEGNWLHVARMDVTIVECITEDGERDEETLYRNILEYWAIDRKNKKVYGPMNDSESTVFLSKNRLKKYKFSPPDSYKKYENEGRLVCSIEH